MGLFFLAARTWNHLLKSPGSWAQSLLRLFISTSIREVNTGWISYQLRFTRKINSRRLVGQCSRILHIFFVQSEKFRSVKVNFFISISIHSSGPGSHPRSLNLASVPPSHKATNQMKTSTTMHPVWQKCIELINSLVEVTLRRQQPRLVPALTPRSKHIQEW